MTALFKKAHVKTVYFLRTFLPIALGSVLLLYIIIRAVLLPITHDESNTCFTYSELSFHDIVTYAIPVPNNHILNTLLIKFFASLFGMHQLIARLPNILAFVLYFIAVYKLTLRISPNPYVSFFSLCMMLCNPFLIDFFSLARGYALSISFMMASVYFAWLFIRDQKNSNLACSIFLGMLGVYSNFTIMDFYFTLVILLGIITLQDKWLSRKENHLLKSLLNPWSIIAGGSLLLAAVSYVPITKMLATNQFQYWGMNGFYVDTILTLLRSSLYGISYFRTSVEIISYPIIGFAVIMFLVAIVIFFRQKGIPGKNGQVFFMFVFAGTILINVIQFHLFHVPYLTTRTALFFYPLLAINLGFFAEWLRQQKQKTGVIFSITLTLLIIAHMARAVNFRSCYEWWYDENTFDVLNFLEKEHEKNRKEKISLNTNWLYFPSMNFYVHYDKIDWLHLAPFHQDIQPDSSYDYYYATSDDKPTLDSVYETVLSFGGDSRLLMKRK
jgi:hypothetical protein